MQTIWKYALEAGTTILEMPEGAVVLDVQLQHGTPCLWASVDDMKPRVRRLFAAVGTGHSVPAAADYIGTFQMMGGALVWHLFELRSKDAPARRPA